MTQSQTVQHYVIQSLNHFLMCAYKMYRKRLTLWNEAQERLTKGKAVNIIVSNLRLGKKAHFKGNNMKHRHINSPTGEDLQLFSKPSTYNSRKKCSSYKP